MLLDCFLDLGPEAMAIKKSVRSVDLVLQFIIALQEQLLHQLVAVPGQGHVEVFRARGLLREGYAADGFYVGLDYIHHD